MKKSVFERAGNEPMFMLVLAIILCLTALWAVGCGGGGSNSGTPTTPTGSTGGAVGATITITAAGLSDATPRINAGDRLRFVNNDSRVHQILTTPHLIHTDCPGLNSVGSIAPGQSGTSDPLTTVRGCGFHDHLLPDDNSFRGQVLVGLGSGDPTPPTPGYLRR
jgi:plastocyanin